MNAKFVYDDQTQNVGGQHKVFVLENRLFFKQSPIFINKISRMGQSTKLSSSSKGIHVNDARSKLEAFSKYMSINLGTWHGSQCPENLYFWRLQRPERNFERIFLKLVPNYITNQK